MKLKATFIFIILSVLFCAPGVSSSADSKEEEIFRLIMNWQMKEAAREMRRMKPSDALKGVYSFYSGDYQEAYGLLEGSGTWWEDLARITAEAVSVFTEKETDNFLIRYSGRDEVIALQIAALMEEAAENLNTVFGWMPEEKVIIEIYPDRETFQSVSTLTDEHIRVSGAVGICKFNRIMMVSPRVLMFGYGWPDTSVHEYVHYVVGNLAGLENVPLWLNEGLAKNFEESWRREGSLTPAEKNYLIRGADSGEWVELEKMKYGMPTLESREEVSLAFAQVHSMARYLEKEYGGEKFGALLRALRELEADRAFEEIFGADTGGLLENWKGFIEKKGLVFTPGAASPSFAFSDDPVSAVGEWVAETAAADVRIAGMFESRGSYAAAERKYSDALRKNPGSSVILTSLGRVRLINGNAAGAAENFREAIKNNPSYPPPYIRLAALLLSEENYEEAALNAQEYIYHSPFNPEAYEILARALAETGDESGALRAGQLLGVLNEHN